jgi:glycosyltransferase involved in cell wall biosynthesis
MDDTNVIISIIIPCYNHGIYIDEAIKSVEEYKSDNYEIIIINDGSTDEFTNMRLTELKNEGYNVIFQENQGLGKTRNNAIRLAKGKYILPLDADNLILPDYIIKSINILETNPHISIVYSDRQCFGNLVEIINVGDFSKEKIIDHNYIDACAVFRKSLWEQVGGYDEIMPIQGWEDWDFWLLAIENNAKFCYISEILFKYRVVENSMIHKLNALNTDELHKYIYKKHSILFIEELKNKISKLENQVNNIRNSKAYRLGKFLLRPFTYLKNLYG